MTKPNRGNAPLPQADDLLDCIDLALDVMSTKPEPLSQEDVELRRYLKAARRYSASLIGGAGHAA